MDVLKDKTYVLKSKISTILSSSKADPEWSEMVAEAFGTEPDSSTLPYEDMPALFESLSELLKTEISFTILLIRTSKLLQKIKPLPYQDVEKMLKLIRDGIYPDPEELFEGKQKRKNVKEDEDREKRQKKLKPLLSNALTSFSSTIEWYDKFNRAYGGTKNEPLFDNLLNEDLPILFQCIDKMTEKKLRYQNLLYNTYFLLEEIKPLSFERVKMMVESIKKDGVYPNPEELYEGDEDDGQISIEKVADLNNLQQLEELVSEIYENVDDYVRYWQLQRVFYRIDPPKHVKEFATDANGVLSKASKHEKFTPMLETIMEKIIVAGFEFPLFQDYSNSTSKWRYYVGNQVIARLTSKNPERYDVLMRDFLCGIRDHSEEYFLNVLIRIQRVWADHGGWGGCEQKDIPMLPKTFHEFPELATPIDVS